VIALKGMGGGIRRRFGLLRLDGFQVKVEIVNMCLESHQVLWAPLGFPFNLSLVPCLLPHVLLELELELKTCVVLDCLTYLHPYKRIATISLVACTKRSAAHLGFLWVL
jgi:hypothetical protein